MTAGERGRGKEGGEKRKKSDGEIPDLMSGDAGSKCFGIPTTLRRTGGSLQDADGQDRNLLYLPILLEQ